MAETVGQHSVAAFTSPVNGTTPIDANTVRGNDNTVRSAYVDHDADPGIHVQSSTLASRPVAGTAGRKWITISSGRYQLWYDDGSRWNEVASDAINVDCLADTALTKGDVVKITGFNNGQNLPTVAKVSASTDTAFGLVENTVGSGALVQIINTGLIEDVDTNGYAVGTILYPNTSGGWTTTKPTSGNYQPAGYVLRGNTNTGVLYVEFSAPRIVERSDNTASTIVLRDASGNFSAGTITAGAVTSMGLVTFASLKGTGATTVTNILDEDNMASDSATALATQQSIKAYVDAKVATVDTLAEVLANGNTTGANNIIVTAGQKITTNTIDETTSGSGVTIDSVLLKDDVVNATDIETGTVSANDGTLAVTIANSTGALTLASALADSNLATISTAGKVANSATTATSTNTNSAIVARDSSGNFSAGTITANLTGNISGTAPAGTLTGTTLASNVVSSSLTSVGTLTSLAVTGDLTVDTSTLKVDSTNNRVGVVNASPAYPLDVTGPVNSATGSAAASYKINGTDVLTATTLGSGVTASSLTSVGTLTSLTVSGDLTVDTNTLYVKSSTDQVGVGTTNPGSKLHVAGAFTKNTGDETTWGIRSADTTSMAAGVGGGMVFTGLYTTGGAAQSFAAIAGAKTNATSGNSLGELRFYTSDTSGVLQQRASFDGSGNLAVDTNTLYVDAANNRVGIGTASPGYALDVFGTSATALRIRGSSASTNNTAMRFFGVNANADMWAIGNAVSTNDTTRIFEIYDLVASASRVSIDASGNLGLGVTPSAWGSIFRGIQIGTTMPAFLVGRTDSSPQVHVGTNAFYDGTNWKYVSASSAQASRYYQGSGQHIWETAVAGTSGNNVSFTQAMTLDASGNLGVGSTAPSSFRGYFEGTSTGSVILGVRNTSADAGALTRLFFGNGTGSSRVTLNLTNGELFYMGPEGNFPMYFQTNGSERARITSGGYFKASDAGTYGGSTSAYHELRTSADNYIAYLTNTHASAPYGPLITYTAAAPNGTGNAFIAGSDTGGTRFALRSNGGLANYQANNVDLSDARTKTDITPLDSMWGKVAALEIVSYKYIDQTHDDVNLGVIAQQVETVEPVWVDSDGFGDTPEGEEPMKTVYNKDIYFAAIKALQEAMARIEALEARLEALEA